MTHYKRAPEDDLSTHVSDPTPVPRQEFAETNHLYAFTFDEDFRADLYCPDDCGAFCTAENLGEMVDWAVGHQCAEGADR